MLDDIGLKEHAKEWLDKRLDSKQVVWEWVTGNILPKTLEQNTYNNG